MKETRALRSGASHGGYIMRPLDLSLFGAGDLTPSQRVILSALFSVRKETKDGKIAEFSAREIAERYRVSLSTAYRAIQKALSGAFSRAGKIYRYQFDGGEPARGSWLYFVMHDFLRFAQFKDNDGKVCRLTDSQIEILELLRDYETRGWKTTRGRIASALHIAVSTVSVALELFGRLHLVSVDGAFNPGKWKRSVNHYDDILYRVNEKLLERKRAEIVQREKSKSEAAKDLDARAARERYYAVRKQARENAIDAARAKLDPQYLADEREARILDIEIAKAEVGGFVDRLAKLSENRERLIKAMKDGLRRCGLEEADLDPPPVCKLCNDTGVLPDHTYCTCYLRR